MIHQPLGKIDCFGISKKHPMFNRNTDRFVIADVRPSLCIHDSSETAHEPTRFFGPSQGQLLMIADGVGIRPSAARASALAVDTVNTRLLNAFGPDSPEKTDNPEMELFTEFRRAIGDCRDLMTQEVKAAERFSEMGAVLTLVYIDWPRAHFMHIGNNRGYHVRRQHVEQVTNDHTLAKRLVDAGQISRRQAADSKLRNIVWNVIGTQSDQTDPEFDQIELRIGDAIVLCSDGMAAALNENDIADALQETKSAEETCQRMFEIAGDHLNDDATLVVARFVERDADQLRDEKVAEPLHYDPQPATEYHKSISTESKIAAKKMLSN